MSKSLFASFCASLVLAAAAASTASAQGAPGAPVARVAHGGVAIIDLPYILKHHAGFHQQVEALRREAEVAENEIKAKRDAIQKMAMQLDDYAKGSPEYRKLDEDITQRQATLSVEFNITKKKFMEAEARVYFQVYQQILHEVKLYSEANNISLVLKFLGDEPNKDNPEEVAREVNKLVLYYNPAIDITPIILDRLKGQAPRPNVPVGPAARPTVPPNR